MASEGKSRMAGQTIADRYEVQDLIGRGGMGEVYLARHRLLGKEVAIKVLREESAHRREALIRFHREAMAAATIGHPHIVDVTDYGFTARGEAYLVMERLQGQTLREILAATGPLAPARALELARQTLGALGAAHARGIVHRDLKPANIFVTQREGKDFVKLLDFGISTAVQLEPAGAGAAELEGFRATGLTATGALVGTPSYVAPEQVSGDRSVDSRADLYAAGVILYEMLTGEVPFAGDSTQEVLAQHLEQVPAPPRQRRPELAIPQRLEQVVVKALAKRPEERFASAEEMRAALVGRGSGGWLRIAAVVLGLALCLGGAAYLVGGSSSIPAGDTGSRADAAPTLARTAPPDSGPAAEGPPAPERSEPTPRPARPRGAPKPSLKPNLLDLPQNPYPRKKPGGGRPRP